MSQQMYWLKQAAEMCHLKSINLVVSRNGIRIEGSVPGVTYAKLIYWAELQDAKHNILLDVIADVERALG